MLLQLGHQLGMLENGCGHSQGRGTGLQRGAGAGALTHPLLSDFLGQESFDHIGVCGLLSFTGCCFFPPFLCRWLGFLPRGTGDGNPRA